MINEFQLNSNRLKHYDYFMFLLVQPRGFAVRIIYVEYRVQIRIITFFLPMYIFI